MVEQSAILETDTIALKKLEDSIVKGIPYEEAFSSSMKDSSISAKEFAIETKGASGSTDIFITKQKNAQAALKATTTATKGAAVAMKALSMLKNMAIIFAITEVIEIVGKLIDNQIHKVEKINEEIDSTRSNYDETVSNIKSMNDELNTTQDKINDLQSKGSLSFTDQQELENLKEQNTELEKNISLQEQKKKSESTQLVNDVVQNKDTLFKDFKSTLNNFSITKKSSEESNEAGLNLLNAGEISVDRYQDQVSENESAIEEYKNKVIDQIERFEQYKQDIVNKYETDDSSSFSKGDQELYNDITAQLQEAYKLIYSNSEYNKFVIEPIFDTDKLQGLQDQLLQYFSSGGNTDLSALEDKFGSDIITALRAACENAGIDFNQMIEDMYNNANAKLNRIAPITNNPNGAYEAQQNNTSKVIRDYVQNELSDEDRTLFLNAEIPDDVKFKTTQDVDDFISSLKKDAEETPILNLSDYFSKDQEYLEYISQLGKVGKIDEDSIQSLKDYDKLLEMCGGDAKKLVEELQKISKESNGTNGSIEAANNLATTDKGYKALDEAYQQAMQNGFVDSTTISSLYDQFGDLDVFDKFVEAMQNIGNAAYDTQAAFDSLSNSYARSNIDLNDLTDATAKQYETELTRQGVENAEQAISERLAYMNGIRAQALEELHNANITTITSTDALNNATTDEINAIISEIQAAGGDATALKSVAMAKQGVNAAKISTTTDVGELLTMAKAAGVAGSTLSLLGAVKNNKIPDSKAAATIVQNAKKDILNALNNFDLQFTPYNYRGYSGTTGTGTSGTGSSSSTKKTPFDKLSDYASQFFDWIEVRLDRLQKKIDSNISKAESKLNDKRYSSATSNYMSAVGNTYTKLYTEQKGRDKYLSTADSYLNKAVSLGAINKKLAKEIKARVADGSINISRYSSDIQTVISTYKDWIDKAKDCTTAMQTLHDSFRTYAEDLKKVSDAQRDATVSIAETRQTIATGGVQNTATAKNSSLGYNNSVLNTKNSAYYTAAKSANSNVNRFAKSATSALNKGKIKKNSKYNATLNSIKGYIKKRVAIPDSLLAIVAKKNATLYNRLYMYNLGIENLQTAREEYATAFAANNAERYNNIADKYKNLDDATNDAMDLNSTKSSNSVYAKDKNDYLDKQKSGYGTIVTHDKNEQDAYDNARKSARNSMSKSAKGASYSSLSKKSRTTINKYVDDAKKSAKSGKTISASTIAKLSEYYKKGYITRTFLDSCINYNNALESYNQAKAQAEIDKQTQITQRAEIASQKFSNIATEYDNKRHTYEQTATELNNKMSILEAKGNGASDVWYQRLYTNEQKANDNWVSKRKDLIDSLNKSVESGDIQKYSKEWYDLRSQIDDCTNSIDESTKSLQEYKNQMEQIKWDRIDESVQKIQNFVDENDFMINELSRRDLTSDDIGRLTKEGDAVAGLHIANYKAYQEQAQSYADAITDINKKLADDPYNQRYIEQKEKLVKSYQDATKSAQDEKFATIDLMKSGYDALKNHISDLIDKYQDLIDSEKDAYDYANNIESKTKTLSDLHKQLIAFSDDTSEESRAKIQQLNVSLKDAEKDLKDTQYDKLISSTKDMLSDFQNDLSDSIQDIIKSLDGEFDKLIKNIDKKWGTSSETVSSLMGKINYTEQFDKLLGNDGVLNGTKGVLEGIKKFCDDMWAEYDKKAEETKQDDTGGESNPTTKAELDKALKDKEIADEKNKQLEEENRRLKEEAQIKANEDAKKAQEAKVEKEAKAAATPKAIPSIGASSALTVAKSQLSTIAAMASGKSTKTATNKAKTYISQHAKKASKSRDKYGLLNKTLYDNYNKKVMTSAQWTELAKILGFKNYSSDKNSAFWKKLHSAGIKGFKKGSDGIPYDMIANLGENGTELQYDISKGVLKSVGQGDMIFTAEQAKTLMEFAKNPMAYKNMYTGTAFSMPSVPVNNKVDNDVSVTFNGGIHMDGVNDPNTFAKTLIDVYKNNTGNARKMLKEDTIGSLSKGYNSQSVKRW